MELLTVDMQRPRLFIFDDVGNMLVGSGSGHVYKLEPPYNFPEPLLVLADYPHSLAIRDGFLYIAQTSSLSRIPYKSSDDILDEGNTMQAIIDYCREQGADEVVSAVLLDKRHERRLPGVAADYAALEVDDRYVFGFGMDYEGCLRHLDAIHALKQQQA